VLTKVVGGQMTAGEAAAVLELSVRQVRRLVGAYREEGAAALAHGNRGRVPPHALSAQTRAQVVALARTKYAGYNHQHLSEELAGTEELPVSRASVRRILLAAGLPSPRKRRPPKHRRRRERYSQEGMLVQIDGSRHTWLEGRGPDLTLVGAIDDATGTVPAALFREQEDAHGYFLLLERIVRTHGRPLALYHDKHGIFAVPRGQKETLAAQLAGRREPTQFGRLLEELGIGSIPAHSPQAKGRIERLWGTFQDRLVSELRRANAATLAEANAVLAAFLPRFNARFAVPAAVPGTAYRPLAPGRRLEDLFCFKYQATVGADNVVRFGAHRLQLLSSPQRASYARATVEVHERLDGRVVVVSQGVCLASTPAPPEAPVLRARDRRRAPAAPALVEAAPIPPAAPPPAGPARRPATPAADHPWRRPVTAVAATRPRGPAGAPAESPR